MTGATGSRFAAPRGVFFAVFAVSGFAGLVYESIWSHYLKLFLGHAAYAQTLVLALYMGGMAFGAWIASVRGARWSHLLRAYAIAEALIGLAALAFHPVFVAATDSAYSNVLPALGTEWLATAYQWTLAGTLLLPQTVLLGMTFPLMSAGLLRRHPGRPGETLALLYFTNSFGAAVGVLASAFIMIERLGLPGTIQAAGWINLALALAVFLLAPGRDPQPRAITAAPLTNAPAGASYRLLLIVAALTGAASFIYEIGWIRMLALVLGSSTHSFELMLAAFILGLALGGLWIRRRIDTLAAPVRFLAFVQIAMGILAAATLPLYGSMFDLMQAAIQGLARTDSGYTIYLLASSGIALIVMLPATFCAGMTLPLITYALLAGGHGEKSIGAVYSANTLGAIGGVFTAAHFALPLLGLKGLILTGALLDVLLGIVLLRGGNRRMLAVAASASGAALLGIAFGATLDPYKMASGVFRRGSIYSEQDAKVVFYKDGKTASVSLVQFDEGLSLRTNGKSDGAINLDAGARISDEVTMVMTAALPLAYVPDAKRAAVIGIGTGLTTHTLLGSLDLDRVDTIEIEPVMAEASRRFAARNGAAFADPRSHIVFDDAKSYFSTRNERYDIIISEPSNPWVSGVSNLFTGEFYRRVRHHLRPGGVMVQWFQLYEIDVGLVASVISALADNFPDFAIYAATDSDLLIVAGDRESLARPLADVFARLPGVGRELREVHVRSIGDIEARRVGGRETLLPMFLTFGTPANSDYRPYLDTHAAKARFLQSTAGEITLIGADGVPIIQMLERRPDPRPLTYAGGDFLERIETAREAAYAYGFLLARSPPEPRDIPALFQKDLDLVRTRAIECRDPGRFDVWGRSLAEVGRVINAGLPSADAAEVWRRVAASPCHGAYTRDERELVRLFAATAKRDADGMAASASTLLASEAELSAATRRRILAAGMTGLLAAGHAQGALAMWNDYAAAITRGEVDLDLRLLYAYAVVAAALPRAR